MLWFPTPMTQSQCNNENTVRSDHKYTVTESTEDNGSPSTNTSKRWSRESHCADSNQIAEYKCMHSDT